MTVVKHTRRGAVLVAVMLSMSMVAFEATVVATAMPQIAAELGDLSLYSWVFTAYLLAQTALTIVGGKLADVYGRKPVILSGVAVFVLASIAAGFAQSMMMLIIARLLQGVGAAALQPAALTIIGDLYPGRERGKIQGYLAGVWAVSAVIGPLLGGVIVDWLTWPWIFWINVPLGLIAAEVFRRYFHEPEQARFASVDWIGTALLTLTICAVMILIGEGLRAGPLVLVTTAAIALVGLGLFIVQQRRSANPIISLSLWRRRRIAVANAATLFSGGALMGLTAMLPIYVQVVLDASPIVAGMALTIMMVGWPMGTMVAARQYHQRGPRILMIAGGVFLPVGAAVLLFLQPISSPWLAGVSSLVMGLGMGLISVTSLMTIQEATEVSERGAGTASNLFARNLGNTLGAAILGGIVSVRLYGDEGLGASTDELRTALLSSAGTATDMALRTTLQEALHLAFFATFAMAVMVTIVALLMPPGLPERDAHITEHPHP
ncbi:MDR family MFS transporter [Devosia riboflavina]|uniref:MDR family MFS transporter n=1 Tax=Devosia riboflavina TaxID=46914 RepID=UPI0006911EF7|nr:MDR family MFS transporter [Devosia riboflavina]